MTVEKAIPYAKGWGPSTEALVIAENVHKNFGRLEVLKRIDLQVERGEVMCIVGPSGSGKSTFLRCINHLEKLTAGRLWVNGELMGYKQKRGRLYELRDTESAVQRRDSGRIGRAACRERQKS